MRFAIFNLPEELTPQWDKQPLGNQVVTTVANLLELGNVWQCMSYFHPHLHNSSVHVVSGNIPGLLVDPATLSITHCVSDVLVTLKL